MQSKITETHNKTAQIKRKGKAHPQNMQLQTQHTQNTTQQTLTHIKRSSAAQARPRIDMAFPTPSFIPQLKHPTERILI
jgi:hypothetical protein